MSEVDTKYSWGTPDEWALPKAGHLRLVVMQDEKGAEFLLPQAFRACFSQALGAA